jgi:hypothetical protein
VRQIDVASQSHDLVNFLPRAKVAKYQVIRAWPVTERHLMKNVFGLVKAKAARRRFNPDTMRKHRS